MTLPQLGLDAPWNESPGEAAVNAAVRERALALVSELAAIGNVWGGYEVHLEETGLVSLVLQYYAYRPPMAHPMHLRDSVTADLSTGRIYTLGDLFSDERYVELLSEAVARQIEERELPLLGPFPGVAPDQPFYLKPGALVLYYQLYELVPYAWGFPEFEVPLGELRAVARPDGPIGRLLQPGMVE